MRVTSLLPSAMTTLHLFSMPFALSQTPSPSSTAPSMIEQPIIHPARSDILEPGGIFTFQWTPDAHFSNVTLELWDKTSWGYSRDFGSLCYHWVNPFCGTIVSHAPNTGSYEWHIPSPGSKFPRGERVFWIKMYVDDYVHPEIGNNDPVLSYSQNFAFAPAAGQGMPAIAESSTMGEQIPMPTGDEGPGPPGGTVYVTVYDGTTSYRAATDTSATSGAATTSISMNGTQQTPAQGGASQKCNVLGVLLLFLGLI